MCVWVREVISTDSSFSDKWERLSSHLLGRLRLEFIHCTRQHDTSKIRIVLKQVSDVIDMKEDGLNLTVLTMVLSEERGHVYQFQTAHDLAVFR